MNSRPSTSHGPSSTLPIIKSFRFSSSHDVTSLPQTNGTSTSAKRTSRLQEFMGRSRTASLPPRPQTSNGLAQGQGRHKHLTVVGKGKASEREESQDSAASSSLASVADPFAAQSSASASFITYSPTTSASFSHFPQPIPPASPTSPVSPQSSATTDSTSNSHHAVSTSSAHGSGTGAQTRRRGSILQSASDAFSSLARINPIGRSRSSVASSSSGKNWPQRMDLTTAPTQIILTEVIEISESAVRESRRKEEEEEEKERERLREVAARALGIGMGMGEENESGEGNRHSHGESDGEDIQEEGVLEIREIEDADMDIETPTATSPSADMQTFAVPPIPPPVQPSSVSKSERSRHTRSRSGSFLPIPLALLSASAMSQRSSTSYTPSVKALSVMSASSQVAAGVLPTTSAIPAPAGGKSRSTPPALTLNGSPSMQSNRNSIFSSPAPLSPSTSNYSAGLRRTPSNRAINRISVSSPPVIHNHAADKERTLPPPKIPPFPSTVTMLTPFVQHTGTIPRYYPAPSLLMFALSKQWKNRYLVLTSPLLSQSRGGSMMSPTSPLSPETPLSGQPLGKNPAPSYLHLFKSSGSLERELERLEIDDESLIYVADAEVGGRRGVVKVEGTLRRRSSQNSLPTIHASGSRSGKDATGNGNADDSSLPSLAVPAGGEEGRTTWVVQILDSEEAQKWIGAIKNAVLSQRSIRAGLGVPSSSNSAVEPRGDMDVIMSMRAQGLSSSSVAQGTSSFSVVPLQQTESFSSPMGNNATIRAQGGISPTQSTFASEGSRDSPTSSISRSQSASVVAALNSYSLTNANGNGSAVDSASVNGSVSGTTTPTTRPSISTTAALKSLFTIGGSRPRSPSSASVSLHASSPSPPPDDYDDEGQAEGDSFGRAGTSLLSMLRTNSVSSERPMSPVLSIPPTPRVGTPASVALLETPTLPHMLDRKILPDSDRHLAVENQGLGEAFIAKTSRHGVGITLTREQDDVVTIPGRVSTDGMMSPSLQPPPRKRAGTVSSYAMSTTSTSEPGTGKYTYTHANGSTAESLGVMNPNLLAPSPTLSASPGSQRLKDRRARTSWSSVSSFASNDQPPSSPDDIRSRRWSRRSSHPYRMSPPYGPPPVTPPSSPRTILTPSSRHPYAAEGSLSRSSSMSSNMSPRSEVHARPFSPKRASGGSVQSFSTVSTSQSRTTGIGGISIFHNRPRSSHRASMPPPPRPAPNSALPPTPTMGEDHGLPASPSRSAPFSKTSFRESLILRGKRMSFSPPTLPPSSELPPRPDESDLTPSASGHRRSSSQGSGGTTPYSIPPSSPRQSPFPPPDGPLPPTPPTQSNSPSRSSTLLKRRLRILSTPNSPAQLSAPTLPSDLDELNIVPTPLSYSPIFESHGPHTPIGEPITTLQNDPNFLLMSPPTPPPRSALPDTPTLAPLGFVSLSPPPRRGSRRVSTPDKDKLTDNALPSSSAPSDGQLPESGLKGDFTAEPRPSPPPEVDEFTPHIYSPVPRSPGHCAVSLIDVSI